jgi:hypothetical protein
MNKIGITIKGVAAELVLGNYMPTDSTIMNDWSEFYHYNDILHDSLLMMSHIKSVEIKCDNRVVYEGFISDNQISPQKSFLPALVHRALYLKTECIEEAAYVCELETDDFKVENLVFETQDFDQIFKVGKSFLANISYEGQSYKPEWVNGKPVGNLCLLCRYEDGYLIPIYDAIAKVENNR